MWYMMLSVGLAYLLATVFHQPYFWLVGILGLVLSGQAYSDVIVGETKYHYYILRKKWRSWRASKATSTDEEKIMRKPVRGAFEKLRRGKRSGKKTQKVALEVPGATTGEEAPDIIFNAPATPLAEPENAHVHLPAELPVDTRHAAVDHLAPAPTTLATPTVVIEAAEAQDYVDSLRPQFNELRKPSVATTATASSYDSVQTPRDSIDALGRIGYHPEAIVASVGKGPKVQSSKVFNLASALSKRLGAVNPIAERQGFASENVVRELDGDELDSVEDFPFSAAAMVVY